MGTLQRIGVLVGLLATVLAAPAGIANASPVTPPAETDSHVPLSGPPETAAKGLPKVDPSKVRLTGKQRPINIALGGWVRNEGSWKCLAVPGAREDAGIRLIQWECSLSAPDHIWIFDATNVQGLYRIRNDHTGKCLGIPNASRDWGEQALQWWCSDNLGAAPDQFWYLDGPFPSGRYRLIGYHSSSEVALCLGIDQGRTDDGAYVIQWPCSGAKDHFWE